MSTRRATGARVAAACAALAALTFAASPAAATGTTTVGGPALAGRGLVVDADGAPPLPSVRGETWVLADLDTGEVLAAQDPHGRLRPASTLKVLTALALLPEVPPETVYTAQFDDANVDGSKVGVVPDATYTAHNLFEALFLVSGNDAAHALANAAGGVGPTVERMNAVARELGALDTTAVNPSGLDAPGQLTSAYDLAVIARAAMEREDFRAYAATVRSQFPGKMGKPGKARPTFEIYTQDRLLLNYRGAIGVKTGWTTKARGTFVGAATRGGRTLVATVLRSDVDAWRDAARLLTWGFRAGDLARPVGTLDAVPAAAATARSTPGSGSGSSERRPAAAPVVAPGVEAAGLPWWLQVPLVALGVLATLRVRVVLRRRWRAARRRSRLPVPHPRDRRRPMSAVSAAPRPAPTTAPRTVRPLPSGEPPPGSTSSASTGTVS